MHLNYNLSSRVIVEKAMTKLFTKSRYEKWNYFRKANGTLGLKSNIFICYWSFAFILHVKGVNGIVVNVDNLYFEVCCYYRWRIVEARHFFRCSSPFLIYMCFAIGGHGSSTWFLLVPLAICPFWNILSLPRFGSFHVVPFSPPLFGSLFYW